MNWKQVTMEWLNDALLKMTWLRESVEWFFESVLSIFPDYGFYNAGTFFVNDVIKFLILLTVLFLKVLNLGRFSRSW
jgi:hypothetical protein